MSHKQIKPVTYRATVFEKLRFVCQLAKEVSRREQMSRSRQFYELVTLYARKQIGPLAYYQQELWRPRWTMAEKMRCLGGREYEKRLDQLNPIRYQCLGNHKVVEAALFKQFAIPTAEYIGFLHATDGTDVDGRPLVDLTQLEKLLQRKSPLCLCFKPVEGFQGQGFAAVSVATEARELLAVDVANPGRRWVLKDFLDSIVAPHLETGMIIQHYIEQHPLLAQLNPSSVNTLRIWVLQCGQTVKIRGALLRMGRSGKPVDNSSQGGVLAPIDLETGRLGKVKPAVILPEMLSHHPDSGVRVEGMEVPFWAESQALAKATLRAIPGIRFSGLDIAITEQGPLVVETNMHPDSISARNFDMPISDLLDCDADC